MQLIEKESFQIQLILRNLDLYLLLLIQLQRLSTLYHYQLLANLMSFESLYVDIRNIYCRKLATEVVFGRDVIERCSPYHGRGSYPGLPVVELNQLKQMVLDCFPSLWNDLDELKKRWVVCIQGLSKCCSGLNSYIIRKLTNSDVTATALISLCVCSS